MNDELATPADAPVVPEPSPRRRVSPLAKAAAGLALAAGVIALLSGLGTRVGLWDFRAGFTLLRYSAYAAVGILVLSVVAAVLTRPGTPRRGFPLAVLGFLLCAVLIFIPWNWTRTARGAPPIHDISTDTNNPPQFVAIVPLRADAANPVQYGGPEIAAQQREAYPDIQPVVLNLPPDRAFQRALDAVGNMGWELVDADPAAGRIEATDQTFWFGFKDDVVIRLTPLQQRSILDVRSVSRVGRGDAGTNAKRIREYLQEVQ